MQTNQPHLSAKQIRQFKFRYFAFGGIIFSMLVGGYFSFNASSVSFAFSNQSAPIPWDTALVLINRYKDHKKRFRVENPNQRGNPETLKAVIFQSDHLEKLINYAAGKKAEYVYLYFGIDKEEIYDNIFKSHPQYKIVAVAADSVNGKLSLLTDVVYDITDPCPRLCPENSPY